MARFRRITILLSAFLLVIATMPTNVSANADDMFRSTNNIEFSDPNFEPADSVVCSEVPGAPATYTTIGNPIQVGASIFGGTWDGTNLQGDTGDDNGEGLLGKHAGHTMFAELSTPGTKDFAYLAKLMNPPTDSLGWTSGAGKDGFRPGSKFLLTYKGKSIVMEKRDVGGGGGPVQGKPRAIDIWYEAAKLIDFREGLAVMTIQQVADHTPVTPLNGASVTGMITGEVCDPGVSDSSIDPSVTSGGLTAAQARRFMINYGANKNNSTKNAMRASSWNACGGSSRGGGSNCVSFSEFFLNKFTSTRAPNPMGDGRLVVSNLRAKGVPTGSVPKVGAIFSIGTSGTGHTGVVLGIEGDTLIVGHASCSRGKAGKRGPGNGEMSGNGSGFIRIGSMDRSKGNPWYWASGKPTFAYPEIDMAKIEQYLSTGV